MRAIKKVLGCLRKADQQYELINDGDKICVGISGGKDSSILLYCLYLYMKFSKKNYQLVPIYVEMGFKNDDISQLQEFFKPLDLEIIIYKTDINQILSLHRDKNSKLECSLCSKLRKGAIINAAKEYGCNKLAFGHHNEDAVETLFLNMIYGGRISTFQPNIYLERSQVTLIRPLIYAYESDISKAREYLDIPIIKNNCGNDGNTQRQEIKDLLSNIYHKYKCHDNFSLMLRNNKQLDILKPKEDIID